VTTLLRPVAGTMMVFGLDTRRSTMRSARWSCTATLCLLELAKLRHDRTALSTGAVQSALFIAGEWERGRPLSAGPVRGARAGSPAGYRG
jgi:hypothetical protein